MRFHNYKNKYTNNNIIHSFENILAMPVTETFGRSAELNSQYNQIGFPRNAELNASPNAVFVNAYTKDDGTQVCAHWRSKPEGGIIANQIQNGISIPSYNDGIFGDLNKETFSNFDSGIFGNVNNTNIPTFDNGGEVENNGVDVNNQNLQNAIAPILLPMILSQIPMPNMQTQQNVPTGFASDIDTNQVNNYEGNGTATPVNDEKDKLFGGVSKVENIPRDEIYATPKPMTKGEKFKEWLFTNVLTHLLLPMSSDSVVNGMDNMAAARKNYNATVYNSLEELNDKELQNKFKSLGVPDNAKGAVYDKSSYESKKLADSPELERYIKNILKSNGKLLNNENMHLGIKNLRFWDFLNNLDRQASLQNVTIYNPEITPDGKFKCKIIDYSDFKPSKYNDLQIPNNWGYNMQNKGQYKNYYQVFEIEKEIPKKYLKSHKNIDNILK